MTGTRHSLRIALVPRFDLAGTGKAKAPVWNASVTSGGRTPEREGLVAHAGDAAARANAVQASEKLIERNRNFHMVTDIPAGGRARSKVRPLQCSIRGAGRGMVFQTFRYAAATQRGGGELTFVGGGPMNSPGQTRCDSVRPTC